MLSGVSAVAPIEPATGSGFADGKVFPAPCDNELPPAPPVLPLLPVCGELLPPAFLSSPSATFGSVTFGGLSPPLPSICGPPLLPPSVAVAGPAPLGAVPGPVAAVLPPAPSFFRAGRICRHRRLGICIRRLGVETGKQRTVSLRIDCRRLSRSTLFSPDICPAPPLAAGVVGAGALTSRAPRIAIGLRHVGQHTQPAALLG